MTDRTYAHRFETIVDVNCAPERLFKELDDHERLAAHMMRSSAMMAGSDMQIELDAGQGRSIGSHIKMAGAIFGVKLELDEVVTEREPPLRKTWETVGQPRLLVIGGYRMGFVIAPQGTGSKLTIFIDYDNPPGRWAVLGKLLGPVYARWCTVSMAEGAAKAFA